MDRKEKIETYFDEADLKVADVLVLVKKAKLNEVKKILDKTNLNIIYHSF